LSFVTDLNFDLLAFGAFGAVAAVIWIGVIVAGGAFVVSVIEGYESLAGGLATLVLTGYVFVAAWQFNESCQNVGLAPANLHKCYHVRDPETLTVMASILVASLIGFIWWNTHPAQVQLGVSGAFFLGSAIAALAVMTHTELLLIGLFILFTGFARIALPPRSHRPSAKRWPFPPSPSTRGRLQIAGSSEVTIIVRFWIVAGLLSGIGVAVFYGIWAAQ
jgi:phospho-N-acetylmuramoyl-pentapeptide-transferase